MTNEYNMIASNGNFYKMTTIPSGFWEEWKANKTAVKAKGYAPFKRNGEWYLAIYNGKKATKEEIASFEKQQAQAWISEIEVNVSGELDIALSECKNVNEVIDVIMSHCDLFYNASKMLDYIEELVFTRNLSK